MHGGSDGAEPAGPASAPSVIGDTRRGGGPSRLDAIDFSISVLVGRLDDWARGGVFFDRPHSVGRSFGALSFSASMHAYTLAARPNVICPARATTTHPSFLLAAFYTPNCIANIEGNRRKKHRTKVGSDQKCPEWQTGCKSNLKLLSSFIHKTRNAFCGTWYLSHCSAHFAFNPLFVNWVTSLTPSVT